jgi:hypothetical protein
MEQALSCGIIFSRIQHLISVHMKKMIPVQQGGASSVTDYTIETATVNAAKQLFRQARENLLHVNDWNTIAGKGSAIFQVIDNKGQKTNDCVKEGNFLRISIPVVPGTSEGEGADWVIVEKINEEDRSDYQYVGILVRPTPPPFSKEKEAAHFFDRDATSTFSIERNRRKVIAAVNGRNEKPNIVTRDIVTRLRNFFVALGAMAGLNKPQWKKLVRGLLRKKV